MLSNHLKKAILVQDLIIRGFSNMKKINCINKNKIRDIDQKDVH